MNDLNPALGDILSLDGAMCAAIVDSNNGMIFASLGSGIDIEIAAAGNADVVRAKQKTMKMLGIKDEIIDIFITLGKQYHILRPLSAVPGVFMYLVLDGRNANLALARRKVADVERTITHI